MAVELEQSLHYCLSESKMPQLDNLEYMASLWAVMLGLFNCHPYIVIFIWDNKECLSGSVVAVPM